LDVFLTDDNELISLIIVVIELNTYTLTHVS